MRLRANGGPLKLLCHLFLLERRGEWPVHRFSDDCYYRLVELDLVCWPRGKQGALTTEGRWRALSALTWGAACIHPEIVAAEMRDVRELGRGELTRLIAALEEDLLRPRWQDDVIPPSEVQARMHAQGYSLYAAIRRLERLS